MTTMLVDVRPTEPAAYVSIALVFLLIVAIPSALRRRAWPATSLKVREGAAPNAIRTPISTVHRRTTVESTPHKPTVARSAAIVGR